MQILFAISILCFFALVWAGVAIATHVRTSHGRGNSPQRHNFADHFAAAERTGALSPLGAAAQQRVQDILANKSWNQPPTVVTVRPDFDQSIEFIRGKRMSQQASQTGTWERLDWGYFNKDSGDLSDPYEARRGRTTPTTR